MGEENKIPSSKSQKTPLIVLGAIIGLGILALVGMVAFGLGRRQTGGPTVTPTPTLMPEGQEESEEQGEQKALTLTPTKMPTGRPTAAATVVQTVIPTATLAPESTLIPSPTPTPTPIPQPDLYISEYSFDHPPKQGEAFTVRIGLYNKGNAKANGFWWEWWPTKYNFACRARIDEGLVARGGRIVTCTYTYGGWANYETKAVVDADNEVTESDEENNTYIQNVVPIH